MNGGDRDILETVRAQFHSSVPARLAVAVSGGSDSLALLRLLHECFQDEDVELHAATVDHRLRQEASGEARQVGDLCAEWGISHRILEWADWDGCGNLQDKARQARYDLLTNWARTVGAPMLAVGHTADDQAETVLMRLSRSSGVNGLAGMPVKRTLNGVTLFRPLLGFKRELLRGFLRRREIEWIEDPSNENERFERVRVRQAMDMLEPLGISTTVLADVAANLRKAREALDWYTFLAARDLTLIVGGYVVFDARKFRVLPDEISRRLLVRALAWISNSPYSARRSAVTDTLAAIRDGRSVTLQGCLVLHRNGRVWICREHNAVRKLRVQATGVWDDRWRFHGGDASDYEIGALGEHGLSQCPDWRETGFPHRVLLSSPALWKQDILVAAPLAGRSEGWRAELIGGQEEFFASLLSH